MAKQLKVTAQDIMQEDVVRLHTLTPIERAIELLEEYQISGAPVVDEAEELVGVLSMSDVLHRDRSVQRDGGEERYGYYRFNPLSDRDEFFSREDYELESLGRELVADWMTPKVVAVEPEASLKQVCHLMDEEKVHRVLVVVDKRVVGLISSLDIVRWVSRS